MARISSTENNTKREVIIKAAAKLFKEKGFKATSMRALAANVGVEAASLYNHIKTKDDLLKDICFTVLKSFHAHIDQIEAEQLPETVRVEKIIRFHVRQMIDNYAFVYVTDLNWRQMKDPGLSAYRELRTNYRHRLTAIVQRGIDNGKLKNMDANSIVMVILNAINAVDQWHRIIHKTGSKELEDTIASLLIHGVTKE